MRRCVGGARDASGLARMQQELKKASRLVWLARQQLSQMAHALPQLWLPHSNLNRSSGVGSSGAGCQVPAQQGNQQAAGRAGKQGKGGGGRRGGTLFAHPAAYRRRHEFVDLSASEIDGQDDDEGEEGDHTKDLEACRKGEENEGQEERLMSSVLLSISCCMNSQAPHATSTTASVRHCHV